MAAKDLTAARLHELLQYNPETGEFFHIAPRKRVVVGEPAGYLDPSNNYWRLAVDYGRFYAHRLAFLYMTGAWPVHHVDHIDGDTTNNRWANLRDVPRVVNQQNMRRAMRGSSSGLLGAFKKRGRWSSKIRVNGKAVSLGSFETAQQAHGAYIAAKRRLHEGCTV